VSLRSRKIRTKVLRYVLTLVDAVNWGYGGYGYGDTLLNPQSLASRLGPARFGPRGFLKKRHFLAKRTDLWFSYLFWLRQMNVAPAGNGAENCFQIFARGRHNLLEKAQNGEGNNLVFPSPCFGSLSPGLGFSFLGFGFSFRGIWTPFLPT
jgi:hypothetical protein